MKRYLLALTLAVNQLGNALTGGDPGQTISSRAAIAREHGSHVGTVVCSVLATVDHRHERPQEDHCSKALRHWHERVAMESQRVKDTTK